MTPRLAAIAAAAHVLVDNVEHPELRPADRHHLERVLRLRPGTNITVGDGRGAWRTVRLQANAEPTGAVMHEPKVVAPITVAFALTKGDKPELTVQKLTELGVSTIVLFRAARSVVRWDDSRAEANVERLRRVAEAAVCQSRRAWSPTVMFLPDYVSAVGLPGSALAASDGEPYDSSRHQSLLVGPEGGWSLEELAVSVPRVVLGPHILRAETAAIAAGAIAAASQYYRP